jgi:hypothetical protein
LSDALESDKVSLREGFLNEIQLFVLVLNQAMRNFSFYSALIFNYFYDELSGGDIVLD